MTRDEIKAAVLEEIANVAPDADVDGLDAEADLREELDIDSMDHLNIVIALHKRLGVNIPEADYGKLTTLDRLVGYLENSIGV